MHDVAARAGVSIKTVSNVVNDRPHISAETRERVDRAIAELDYQVNVSARNLRLGRTGMIGLAIPALSVAYYGELADLVISRAAEEGLTVVVEPTAACRDAEIDALRGARRRLTDGLLIAPVTLTAADVTHLSAAGPLVILGEDVLDPAFDHVTMADVDGARAATELLLAQGRRRIAVVGPAPGEESKAGGLRLTGYRQALRAAGVPYDESLVVAAGAWGREDGARAALSLLDAGLAPDAVFAVTDTLALGVLHTLRTHGVAVPEDVAVVGFDDVDEARFSHPTLTSVSPGRAEIARTAVRLLQRRLVADGPVEPVVHQAEFRLVERGSTGADRAADSGE
ncbi:LacI family DNA-binding transcriptional regulator [Cellulomonas bogoriensis]|uniref:LacI family transcriptional regulator n=1 Tax=Cellulomonas bogoriensis 69B4 = DSM 16987 TaxID=1386082 RepID=A0A0A0BYQ1_9CELL|nr:LacI family DNA-binding transcriptional regulator [Cellulomonas bogoriensis]KGM13538.1 LacI family transcriptional regulator [Cellulomonas bogoriensis 69B4 = DSM 16987]